MVDPILEVTDLRYAYPCGKEAIAGVSLRVTRGRKLAVLGANGSGKTTLFLCMNGTYRPQRGRILINGKAADYGHRSLVDWRRTVGVVFQDPDDQVVGATVSQDNAFGPLNLGLSPDEARARVRETVTELEIEQLLNEPTHELSHGQRKLVAIAGVLTMRPDLIVLDEPTAGLDPFGARQVMDTLDRIFKSGTTLVMATHDMDLAYAWADEVLIVSNGSILCQEPTEQAFGDPARLRQARLEMPRVCELTTRLKATGVLPAEAAPRTFEELSQLIGQR